MGSGYVIEHCISAFSDYGRNKLFQTYVADCLHAISKTVAEHMGGLYMENSFSNIIEPHEETEMTGDEIAMQVIERAGLKTR